MLDRHRIIAVNPHDRDLWPQSFVLSFGAYGDTHLLAYGDCLESALDECGDWLRDNAPGLLCTDEVHEAYNEAIANGLDEDAAWDEALSDTTPIGGYGDYVPSYEWCISLDNPSREDLIAYARCLRSR